MIELKDVKKTYQMGEVGVVALRGVSLKVEQGEFIAIMGPSGSGKSTLLHILGFLDRPDCGVYTLWGNNIGSLTDDELSVLRNRIAGFVFQQFHLLARVTAVQNVELPLIYAGKRHLKEKALDKIKEVNLFARAFHKPNELSGGEQQRIAIARALVNEPGIILADEPTGNLDTKTEKEIMEILAGLNRKGKTIIMVTHEEEIAGYAGRVIHMRDGKIISDEKKREPFVKSAADSAPHQLDVKREQSWGDWRGSEVEFGEHLRQAFGAIVSHKMRSFLSVLGILIGTGAVVAMMALGQGAKESVSQALSSLGSNLLTVRPGSRQMHGVALEAGLGTRFTLKDAQEIAKLPQVKRVSASVSGRAQVVSGSKNWNTQAQGSGADYFLMRASLPVVGRCFTEEEVLLRQKVVLLGATVARELFGGVNPVGASIKVNRINFDVLGVLPEKGASGWRDQDDVIIIPVTTAMYRLLGREYVDSIDVEVSDSGLMQEAQEAIQQMIVKQHRLTKEGQDSFQIRNMAEIQETLKSTTGTMTWLLGSIAAISLLVGGIGIMNIMLVSVTERTAEIGLRKAIGARNKDIMTQFLIESVVMTFSGGVMGVILGIAIAFLLSIFAGWTTKILASSVITAALFSAAVGIVFGLWPAQKASQLNPIEALRYE